MLELSLFDYSDACILVDGTIRIVVERANDAAIEEDRNNKQVVLKNCQQFTSCISKMNNTQMDNIQDLGIVMRKHNLLEYSWDYANHLLMYNNIVDMNKMIMI